MLKNSCLICFHCSDVLTYAYTIRITIKGKNDEPKKMYLYVN